MPPFALRRLDSADPGFAPALDALIAFESAQDAAIDATVAAIIGDVRARGDAAVLDYTLQFDRLEAASVAALEITADAMRDAFFGLPAGQRHALGQAAARVRTYHERQKAGGFTMTEADGTELGQRVTPLDRVGIYVPGGKAAYPSSVLMNAIPAHVAGVREIIMVVPTPDGVRNPLVLAAAHAAGVSRAFTVGGRRRSRRLPTARRRSPAGQDLRSGQCVRGGGQAPGVWRRRHRHGRGRVGDRRGRHATANPDWVALDLFSQAEHARWRRRSC